MKTRLKLTHAVFSLAVLISGSLSFQSCSPSNEVQPISAAPNTVSVKVTVKNQDPSFGDGQSIKNFRITTTDAPFKVLLDTNITGNFTYNLKTLKPDLNILATLTSTSYFTSDLEIDVNGTMHAYHGGSCPGTEYDITDNISF